MTLLRLNEATKQADVARARAEVEQPGVAINAAQHYRHNISGIYEYIPNHDHLIGYILRSPISGLISGILGAFGTLLVPECALAAGGALNVFEACFIGSTIIFFPASVAVVSCIPGLSISINSNHAALMLTWGALLVSAIGAALVTSAAIGSAVLGIATYNVAACLLGVSACLLTGAMVLTIADRFISWFDGFTERVSAAASAEVGGEPGLSLASQRL